MPTPRHGHDPIPMRRVQGSDAIRQAGDFCVSEDRQRITLAVPTKNPAFSNGYVFNSLPIGELPGEEHWTWNGSEDAPTLQPSVHAVDHWHGWIRNGLMVEA